MSFTQEQNFASKNIHQSLAVIAGAGTGKTSVLIERLKNIAGTDGLGMKDILAITFTEKASSEILARLYKSFGPKARANIPNATTGTFHSFCLKLLSHYSLGGLNIANEANNALINKRIASKAVTEDVESGNTYSVMLLDELGWSHCVNLIEDLLYFRWHALKIFEAINNDKTADYDSCLLCGVKSIFLRAVSELQKHFNRNAITDFQQLEIDALNLLDDKNVLMECQSKYKHILVDECQDTNDIQIELIKKLYNPDKNTLFLVGDPKQSIYRFRGANPSGFMDLTKIIEQTGGKIVELSHNFRSASNLVEFTNASSKSLISENIYQELIPKLSPSDTGVKKLICDGNEKKSDEIRQNEADNIAKLISTLIKDNISPSQIALLFRSINSAEIYLNALRIKGIPCKLFGSKSFIEQDEISDILSFLKWCEYDDEISKIAFLRSSLVSASDEDLLTKEYINLNIYKKLIELKNNSKELVPVDLIKELLSITGYKRIVTEIDPFGTKLGNIEHLCEIASSLPYPQNLRDLLDAVIELKNRSIRWGDPPSGTHVEAVSLLSVHAAKGLEWHTVILPDLIRKKHNNTNPWIFSLNKGLAIKPIHESTRNVTENFKLIQDFEDMEELSEEKRLIYVAMTRAKKNIFICDVDNKKTTGHWEKIINPLIKKVSSFRLSDVGFNKTQKTITNEKYSEIIFNPPILTVSQIEAFDRCPYEFYIRYLDTQKDGLNKKTKTIPAHIKGRIIHSYVNRICNGEDHNTAIANASLEEGVVADEKISHSALLVKNNIESMLSTKNLSDGYHELPFQWNYNNTIISGVIDWLKPFDKNSYEIVDFKTDNIKTDEVLERSKSYELQLLIYALASKSGGMDIKGTKLLFVTPAKMVEHKFTQEQEETTRSKLTKIINDISERHFKKTKSDKCEKCPFFNKCS